LEHIAVVARAQSFGHALLDQQNRHIGVGVNFLDALENHVGDFGRQPHGRLIEHDEFGR
jgi:hypothetical protein